MDTADFKRPIVEVPSDDGSIDRAINDLDARITDWVTAMTEAQDWVIQCAAGQETLEGVAVAGAIETAATPDATAAAEPQEQPAAEPAGEADNDAEASSSKESAGLRVGHLKTGQEAPKNKAGIRVFSAEEFPPEPEAPAVDEDEELLATLDPKIAKKIKIKRRLSNGTKSIRELLDEGN